MFEKNIFSHFQEQLSIWDTYRNKPEFVDSDEDDEEEKNRMRKKQLKQVFQQRQLVIPGGMDIGRFIADSIPRMPDAVVGPKQIKTKYLKDPQLPDPLDQILEELPDSDDVH